MSAIALRLIQKCLNSLEPELDLGSCGLTDLHFQEGSILDIELRKCIHLNRLILSNEWWDYDKSMYVQSFNRGNRNKLQSAPSCLTELPELSTLICSGDRNTQWAIDNMSFVEKLPNLRYLSLAFNKIRKIQGVSRLKELHTLDLFRNILVEMEGLHQCNKLQLLNISANKLTKIEGLEQLSMLVHLDLSGNQITRIEGVEKLESLKILNLIRNKIQKIDGLEQLLKLEALHLAENYIEEINELHYLKNLTELNLFTNQIQKISKLDELINLKQLNLHSNQISQIEGLNKLTGLNALDLSRNLISEITGLENLQSLLELDLSENKISKIEGLTTLKKLHSLNLSANHISEVRGLDHLNWLKRLGLAGNYIKDLSPLLPFILNYNPLRVVLKSWKNLKNEVNVNGNPLVTPAMEIINQGSETVINYFRLLDKGFEYLFEAKMLIVGQPRAGKTSLRFKLFDINSPLPVEEQTTRGIDIERLSFKLVNNDGNAIRFFYNVWDFGGQHIYQTTHQFFLTQRSLYVLVIDTGKDSIGSDDSTVNYWLQAVELLGGNSPLLLVLNEKNERQINIDLPQKRARFEILRGSYTVDLNALIPGTKTFNKKRVEEFNSLREDIEKELKRLPLVGYPMPKTWIQIRLELQELSKTQPYIKKQEFIVLCNRFDVKDYDSQMQLSRIFHDLGIFLHFQDYGFLDDFIVLQNVWATDAVFTIFDNKHVKDQKGKFTSDDLHLIWSEKGYTPEVHKNLLALMMRFELCYHVEYLASKVYIVPEMLDDSAPAEYQWKPNNDLPLHYRYDFMPKGLLTRLIVRLHRHILTQGNRQLVWKSGVVIDGNTLDCPQTNAEIIETWDNKKLLVRVQGKFSKELMSKLSFAIDTLNNDFFKQVNLSSPSQRSKCYKMIPCNCSECRESSVAHYFDFNDLINAKEKSRTIQCLKSFDNINVVELLEGVFSRVDIKLNSQKIGEPKKVFISYSHKDIDFKNDLKSTLVSIQSQNLIKTWEDKDISSGFWSDQIERAMNESDIFLLLITKNYMASEYITSKEVTMAYSLFKSGKAKVFPIICEHCDWELLPITYNDKEFHPKMNKELYVWLGKFQSFPKNGIPIEDWPTKQQGFIDVVNELKLHI